MFHISRSTLYALAAEGKIRSVSLCKNGKTRGRRLYDCASIRAYLHSIA
jgi:Helix-turn-helix domain